MFINELLLFIVENAIMSLIGPDVTMAGPLWAAMHVVITERFKQGKKAMNSVFGGSGVFAGHGGGNLRWRD